MPRLGSIFIVVLIALIAGITGWFLNRAPGAVTGVAIFGGAALVGLMLAAAAEPTLGWWARQHAMRRKWLSGGVLAVAAALALSGWMVWAKTRPASAAYSSGEVLRITSTSTGAACTAADFKPANHTWVVTCAGKTLVFDDRKGELVSR